MQFSHVLLVTLALLFASLQVSTAQIPPGENGKPLNTEKWVNMSRVDMPDDITNENWNRLFISKSNDTLERYFKFTNRRNIGPLLYELNSINGVLNGISIGYHTNGLIYSIDYYLNDKPWETNLLMDSFGRRHFPGNLKDGTGQLPTMRVDGQHLGYITYKDGNMDGLYYSIVGGNVLTGMLHYNKALEKTDTVTVGWFIYNKNDTLTFSLQNGVAHDSISRMYLAHKNSPAVKTMEQKVVIREPHGCIEKTLHIYLDAGVIPVGEWQMCSAANDEIYIAYLFDGMGHLVSQTNYNLKKIFYFNADGSYREQRNID